jgi:hypothetical protein
MLRPVISSNGHLSKHSRRQIPHTPLVHTPLVHAPFVRAPLACAPLARKTATRLSATDKLSAAALRLGIGRNKASVTPGLYFIGSPGAASPVLVSANYRLSFDALRKELSGIDAWILVVDTRGVNVWCAAGKGTFCAQEVAQKVRASALVTLAPGAPLVLPQLSASGVNANELRTLTGRRVVFGPVRARDIPAFLAAGLKKTAAMRRASFTLSERAVLIPVELVHSGPLYLASLAVSLALALPADPHVTIRWFFYAAWLSSSLTLGAAGFPLILPLLPGRFFSVRSILPFTVLSVIAAVCAHLILPAAVAIEPSRAFLHLIPTIAAFLLSGAAVAYLAMNFTGSSTFTNQKGVEREVSRSLPVITGTAAIGMIMALVWAVSAIATKGGMQ